MNKSREVKKSSDKDIKEENDSGKLMVEEERAVGSVSFDVFKYYSKYCNRSEITNTLLILLTSSFIVG